MPVQTGFIEIEKRRPARQNSRRRKPRFYVVSQADVGSFFGVSARAVEQWRKADMPGKTPHGYELGEIARWLRKTGPWRQRAPAAAAADPFSEGDPLMYGQIFSPNLEKYRGEKYTLAKMDRLEKEKQLLPVALVRGALNRVVAAWRAMATGIRNAATIDEARHHVEEAAGMMRADVARFLEEFKPTDADDKPADERPADDSQAAEGGEI